MYLKGDMVTEGGREGMGMEEGWEEGYESERVSGRKGVRKEGRKGALYCTTLRSSQLHSIV